MQIFFTQWAQAIREQRRDALSAEERARFPRPIVQQQWEPSTHASRQWEQSRRDALSAEERAAEDAEQARLADLTSAMAQAVLVDQLTNVGFSEGGAGCSKERPTGEAAAPSWLAVGNTMGDAMVCGPC